MKKLRNAVVTILIIGTGGTIVYALVELAISKSESKDDDLIRAAWKNGYYSAQISALKGNFDNFKVDSLQFEKLLIEQ